MYFQKLLKFDKGSQYFHLTLHAHYYFQYHQMDIKTNMDIVASTFLILTYIDPHYRVKKYQFGKG